MGIYTGNNGRLYIARRESSGLSGTLSLKLTGSVKKNGIYYLLTRTGEGKGALVRALSGGSSGATITFRIVNSGAFYEAGDRVYVAERKRNTYVRKTDDFSISSTVTRGIDNERDIVGGDQYLYGKIRNWTLNSSSEVIDTTALGDSTRTYAPSITSGEGSATLLFYEDTFNDQGNVDREKDVYELVDILFPRDVAPLVIMNLAVDASIIEGDNELFKSNFLFNAYITGASVSVAYGEVVTIDTTFTVDGALIDVPWKPGVDRL